MSGVFTPPALVTDAATLAARGKQTMEEQVPGWRNAPGSIEDLQWDTIADVAAEQAETLKAELTGVFRSLGPLAKTPPIEPVAASAVATFTLADTAGHTVEKGAVVGLRDADNELQGFTLPADLVVAPGASTGTATVLALEPGTSANGVAGKAELIQTPAFVTEVTLAESRGGLEAESEDDYLDRLTDAFELQKPGPVIAADAARLALGIPGVYRATAVDNLKPSAADGGSGSEEANVEKCVTVAVRGEGADASAEVIAACDAVLQEEREVNFLFFVVKPHYMKIDVTTNVAAWPGFSLASVKASVEEALAVFLDPDNYAPDSTGNARRWKNEPILRQSDLFTAVMNVPGVRWCSALTFGKHGGALATTNVNLGGSSAVPALPEVTGAVFTVTVESSS